MSHLIHTDALRLPPASLEAEQALLGALLANNKVYDRVASYLEPVHFADAVHGRVYDAIRRRCERGEVADTVTLGREFAHSRELDEAGGPAYLAELLTAMVSVSYAHQYGELIFDCYRRRQLIDIGGSMVERAFGAVLGEGEAAMNAGDILQAVDSDLAALSRAGVGGQDSRSMEAVMQGVMAQFQGALDRKGGLAGVTTGYDGLDRMLGGFQRQQLILEAGRPGMGKTAIALGHAVRAAAAGARVFVASAEMSAEQVAARAAAAVAGLPATAALRGGLEDERGNWRRLEAREINAIGEASRRLARLPITWDDSAGATVAGIRAKARQLKRRGGLDLLVVDYLGRLRASSQALKYGNRVQEVSEMARGLKEVARELDVPALVLSQLSREVEKRDDKRPVLSDLRDSGEIEQEADVVLFLYRDEYYAAKERPVRSKIEKPEHYEDRLEQWVRRVDDARGRAEVNVAKQRQGRPGPVRLRFRNEQTWFFNGDSDEQFANEPAVPGLPE